MYTCLKESEHLFCYRLQEVSNVVLGRKTFGILENWSLRRGGPNLVPRVSHPGNEVEVVATGGSTVLRGS